MYDINQLKAFKLPELRQIGEAARISKFRTLKKLELIYAILDKQAVSPEIIKDIKILEILRLSLKKEQIVTLWQFQLYR